VLLADHSFNASTFAARVAASTRADMYGSVTAALATLQGDLHGGAATAAYRTLTEVKTPENAEAVRPRDPRSRTTHYGHGASRVQVRDPRAKHLEAMAKELSAYAGRDRLYETAHAVEEASRKVLQEKKPGNNDLRKCGFLHGAGASRSRNPGDEFTCLFACGRIAGWTGHILEQLADNRLIRPQATYDGPGRGTVRADRQAGGKRRTGLTPRVLVVPAIDLRSGKCVRMKQGDPTTATEYDGDPVERAAAFVAQGARRLHVIDLDGAFGSGENLAAVERICKAVEVPVQTGGGLRTVMHAERAFAAGACEIILGTLMVEDERLARNIINRFRAK